MAGESLDSLRSEGVKKSRIISSEIFLTIAEALMAPKGLCECHENLSISSYPYYDYQRLVWAMKKTDEYTIGLVRYLISVLRA